MGLRLHIMPLLYGYRIILHLYTILVPNTLSTLLYFLPHIFLSTTIVMVTKLKYKSHYFEGFNFYVTYLICFILS